MALGVGVAVGARQVKAEKAEADGDITLYCKVTQSWWKADDAAVGAYYWGEAGDPSWPGVRMTAVATDNDVWKVTVPSGHTSIIFTRMNPSNEGDPDWGAKTADLTIPTDGKNLYTITSESAVWGDPGVTGTWSEYEEPAPDVPAQDGYYIVGTKSNWKYAGATKMSAGTDGNKAQLLRYEASAGEIFKVRSYLTGTDTWYGSNYEVGENDALLDIYLNGDDQVYINPTPDLPESEGYYICGLFSSNPCWRYEDAEKMTSTSEGGNVAYYMNMHLVKDDELRVRSYFDDQDPKDRWASVGNTGDDAVEFGEKSGNNFKFTAEDGYYDIYAKYEQKAGDDSAQFYFYVAEHVDTYTIEMTAVLFEGKTKVSTQALENQLAYDGVNFVPNKPAIDGYFAREVYTNENCTVAYTPTEFDAAGHLYVKYTRLGYYMTGDATFAGSEDLKWNVDGSIYLPAATNDPNNKLEGSVVIPNSASEEHPVSIKPLRYANGEWQADSYTMGATYSYAYMDTENPDE